MKKAALVLVSIIITSSVISYGQTSKDFRTPGYKGSVSLIDQFVVWAGLETSHGVMFDRHNYLGAGLGVSLCLPEIGDETLMFGTFFLDYQNYLRDRNSTPVLGVKAGYMTALSKTDASGWNFKKAAYLEPNIGWSWGLKNGCGLTTNLGAAMYKPIGESSKNFVVMPKLSLTFEF